MTVRQLPSAGITTSVWFFIGCLCLIEGSGLLAEEVAGEAFFAEKVRPLLEDKCLGCHSHATGLMEGGLTLDAKSGWETGGDRGPAILPGHPKESLLLKAISYDDPDLQMPPEEKLTAAEIAIFREWIAAGASDPRKATTPKRDPLDWWSLKTLVTPDVPAAGHPIDAFIRHRLDQEAIPTAPRARREDLVRRLYVDLHGYLPTPEELTLAIADDSPQAWNELIDQLLASPRYGERWARHWLDVIHFADSHGCEHDVKRPHAWRFRDYIITRLNEDVPWDRLIREQLAPDVFYPQQPQLMAGLGFVAAGPLELSRASTAPVTFDYLDRDDIVTQTMSAFVSTTANCARCHTHKFDPITQEDYYALQAVFAGVGKGDIEFDTSTETMQRREGLQHLLKAANSQDASILLQPEYESTVQTWIASRHSTPVEWSPLIPEVYLSSGGATLTLQSDSSVLAEGTVPDQETYTVTASVGLAGITAVRVEVLKDDRLPEKGPGRAANGNLHLSEVEIHWFPADSSMPVELDIKRASADFDQEGWTASQAIDGDSQSGWAIFPRVNESHEIVFELAAPLNTANGGRLAVTLKQLYPPKHVIGRFRLSATNAPAGAAQILPPLARNAMLNDEQHRTPAESTALAAVVLKEYASTELSALPAKVKGYGVSSVWSQAKKLESPQKPKVVHLLKRGDFDKPQQEVGPGTLSVIKSLPARFELEDPEREELRRAALADWLAHPDNPLTWRSVVNRVWHYHFGRGLCDTPNDFGRMGAAPSHPELLDWLAVWFRDEAKGSLKQLHRLILTSQTWQQSSLAAPHQLDANNRLLARMSRQRMDADVFRDSVLRIADRLDLTMGGPGVEQFQKSQGPQATPALDYTAYDWNAEESHRRSIYRVVWRGIPDPFMEAMDFPDLGLLAPKRGFSVSALQSLAIYNNDFVLQSSQWLAERVQQERGEPEQQVKRAVELVWLRAPSEQELQQFTAFTNKHGLAALCRVLLNSNEFLFVD